MTGPGSGSSWTAVSRTEQIPAQGAPRHRAVADAEPEPEPDASWSAGLDPTSEPVIISHAVTVILGALVTAGWVTIPDRTIDAVGTIVLLVLSTVGAVLARARVSPLSGGLWASVKEYVEERIAAEVAKYRDY